MSKGDRIRMVEEMWTTKRIKKQEKKKGFLAVLKPMKFLLFTVCFS